MEQHHTIERALKHCNKYLKHIEWMMKKQKSTHENVISFAIAAFISTIAFAFYRESFVPLVLNIVDLIFIGVIRYQYKQLRGKYILFMEEIENLLPWVKSQRVTDDAEAYKIIEELDYKIEKLRVDIFNEKEDQPKK